MNITLHKSKIENIKSEITITGSKSESNRLLLLQALYPELHIENISNSDDSQLMMAALKSELEVVDIHPRRKKCRAYGFKTHERAPYKNTG